jgi:hypothetical protein
MRVVISPREGRPESFKHRESVVAIPGLEGGRGVVSSGPCQNAPLDLIADAA